VTQERGGLEHAYVIVLEELEQKAVVIEHYVIMCWVAKISWRKIPFFSPILS